MMPGTLFSVGVGPGDPDLLTLKAARIIRASPVVAYFARRGAPGHARTIAAAHIAPGAEELRFDYPLTTELAPHHPDYAPTLAAFYADCAGILAHHLAAGSDVALLCEGDPCFYGSSLHMLERLGAYPSEIIAGVTGMSGAWARAGLAIARGDQGLSVLAGTLDQPSLTARLRGGDAAVVMKIGRNLAKIRKALADAGRLDGAVYVERATMQDERIVDLTALPEGPAPYFSIILVPARSSFPTAAKPQ